jgi:hypothetical protein
MEIIPKVIPGHTKRILYKINSTIITEILEMNRDKHLSLQKIIEEYRKREPRLLFSRETLRTFLNRNMGLVYGKIRMVHSRAVNETANRMKVLFLKHMAKRLRDGAIIIFIDESKFQNNHNKMKTWTLLGRENVVSYEEKVKKINLILSCTFEGIFTYTLTEENINHKTIFKFIDKIADKIYESDTLKHKLLQGKIDLYLDNASSHIAKKVKKYATNIGINLLFPPPYLPTYNLAEFFFCDMKNKFYRRIFNSR